MASEEKRKSFRQKKDRQQEIGDESKGTIPDT